jgi:excisionase family DNA binding protein
MRPFLTCAEAAVYLGVSRYTIWRLRRAGRLKATNLSTTGTLLRYHPDDLDKLKGNNE